MSTEEKQLSEENQKGNNQAILIIWVALIMAMFVYFALVQFGIIPKAEHGNQVLGPILLSMGVVTAFISKLLYKKARSLGGSQQALTFYIFSWALAESSAIFGLVNHMISGVLIYTYISFLVAFITITTNIPKLKNK